MRNDTIGALTHRIAQLEKKFASAARRRNDLADGTPGTDPGGVRLRAANAELDDVVTGLCETRRALGHAKAEEAGNRAEPARRQAA